ncbi:hypothetical protein C2G38_2172975 [Gigaspora rosea]|uniref:TLDc domain-containing protein n=1 Tax=Gigaspora rosea TaxID=44941 RepID=A0A397VK16_9GLOM|nr:hypothetical protein C2G38_2172975 [Gigaspora rosea]
MTKLMKVTKLVKGDETDEDDKSDDNGSQYNLELIIGEVLNGLNKIYIFNICESNTWNTFLLIDLFKNYTGVISFENVENSTIFDLLVSSDKLDFDELVEYIQTDLIDNSASWLLLKFSQVHNASFEVDKIVTLLKKDNLQVEEIGIWEKLPARETSIESCIINEEYAAEISSWINRHSSPYDVTKILLYDNIPRTVVIIKVDGTNEILGRYNPLVWHSSIELKIFNGQ